MNRRIRICIIILAISAFSFWIYRVWHVNKEYRFKKESYISSDNSQLEVEKVKYTITEAKVYDFAAFMDEYDDVFMWTAASHTELFNIYSGEELRVLLIKLSIDCSNVDGKYYNTPYEVRSVNGQYRNMHEITMFDALNPNINTKLANYDLLLPYVIYKDRLTDEEWKALESGDTGFEAVFAYQPVKQSILINDAEYIVASDEQTKAMLKTANEWWNQNEFLYRPEIATVDKNVFSEGEGNFEEKLFKVKKCEEITLDYFGKLPEKEDWFTYDEIKDMLPNDNYGIRLFDVEFEVENTSEILSGIFISTITLIAASGNNIDQIAELIYMDAEDQNKSDVHAASYFAIEPGKKIVVNAIYMSIGHDSPSDNYYGLQRLELWDTDECYLCYFPAGAALTTLNDKTAIFIKTEIDK